MAEKGFYHPRRGYWQTVGEPPAHVRAKYPEGTVEVPLKPGSNYEWAHGEWKKLPDPPPTLSEIKSEVQRRILIEASRNTQINMAAAAAAGRFDASDAQAYQDALDWVDVMRAKGRELYAAGDATYQQDSHWPEPSAAARALAAKY